jgi:hypothetical protein
MLLHWIDCAFVNAGFRGRIHDDWKTNPLNDSSIERLDRGVQVKEWFDKHQYKYKLGQGYDPYIGEYFLVDLYLI